MQYCCNPRESAPQGYSVGVLRTHPDAWFDAFVWGDVVAVGAFSGVGDGERIVASGLVTCGVLKMPPKIVVRKSAKLAPIRMNRFTRKAYHPVGCSGAGWVWIDLAIGPRTFGWEVRSGIAKYRRTTEMGSMVDNWLQRQSIHMGLPASSMP